MIYLLPLLFLIIGFINFDRNNKNRTGHGLWILTYVTLVLIFGLRYKVGADTYNYINYFTWAPTIKNWRFFDPSLFEPGFTILSSFIKTFTDNIYIYQTIISSLMTFFLMLFVKRNTLYKFLAMILIYIAIYPYFSTEVMRESLSASILLVSYPLLEKRKYLQYNFLCFIMLSFHFSAALCFLLPFFQNLRFNKTFLIYIISFIVMAGLSSILMNRMSSFFIFQKLARYSEQSYVGYIWCGLRFIYFSILPMLTIYTAKHTFKLPVKFENLICLQILFGFGLWFVPIVFQRLINYTIIFYLVSLANILGTVFRNRLYRKNINIKVRLSRTLLANSILILTVVAHFSYYIHLSFYEIYIPYHSIIDPIEEPVRYKYIPGNH